MQGYVNLKGHGEFDAHDRASGWHAWLTFSSRHGALSRKE
jgi:hypothetical protein